MTFTTQRAPSSSLLLYPDREQIVLVIPPEGDWSRVERGIHLLWEQYIASAQTAAQALSRALEYRRVFDHPPKPQVKALDS
jgi:hypothetical protein